VIARDLLDDPVHAELARYRRHGEDGRLRRVGQARHRIDTKDHKHHERGCRRHPGEAVRGAHPDADTLDPARLLRRDGFGSSGGLRSVLDVIDPPVRAVLAHNHRRDGDKDAFALLGDLRLRLGAGHHGRQARLGQLRLWRALESTCRKEHCADFLPVFGVASHHGLGRLAVQQVLQSLVCYLFNWPPLRRAH
jgi:hypothetical protein